MLPPTLAEFLAFIRSVMGINTTILPDSSPVIAFSFNIALAIVNQQLAVVGIPNTNESLYSLAVYNLAGDRLLNFAPDQPGASAVPGSVTSQFPDGQPFFQFTRNQLKLTSFQSGVVSSTSDEGTSVSLQVPEALMTLTISDLQRLKTPYGRQYLEFAQEASTLWGIT